MKNLTLAVFFIFLFSNMAIFSQQPYESSIRISLGYGAGNTAGIPYYLLYSPNKEFKTKIENPFNLKFEYGLNKKNALAISLSHVIVRASWQGYNSDGFLLIGDNNSGYYKLNSTSIIFRVNHSIVKKEKLEIYFGEGFGFRVETFKYFGQDVYYEEKPIVPISIEASLGMRYYFTPNIGLYSELGLAKSIFQGGLVLKF